MDFLTPESISAYGIGGAIVLTFVVIFAKDGFVKFLTLILRRGELLNKELENKLNDEAKDETLERETRQIVNQVAIDTRKQLSELQSSYIEQSEVLTKQIEQLSQLSKDLANCRDVAVPEYKMQITQLLDQVEKLETAYLEQQKTIAKQQTDIQIYTTMLSTDYKDTDHE
jgi:hypothetical protein